MNDIFPSRPVLSFSWVPTCQQFGLASCLCLHKMSLNWPVCTRYQVFTSCTIVKTTGKQADETFSILSLLMVYNQLGSHPHVVMFVLEVVITNLMGCHHLLVLVSDRTCKSRTFNSQLSCCWTISKWQMKLFLQNFHRLWEAHITAHVQKKSTHIILRYDTFFIMERNYVNVCNMMIRNGTALVWNVNM